MKRVENLNMAISGICYVYASTICCIKIFCNLLWCLWILLQSLLFSVYKNIILVYIGGQKNVNWMYYNGNMDEIDNESTHIQYIYPRFGPQ